MSSVSMEYARSLFELSSSKKEKHELKDNLEASLLIFKDETYKFFNHPEISKEIKKEIITKSFEDSLFRNFLYVLVDNDRLRILKDIYDDFTLLLLNEEKTTKVIVYSKEKISDDYKQSLTQKLKTKIESEIEIENVIDKSIIGGIRIVYDSKEIDLTINKKFNSLISNLKE